MTQSALFSLPYITADCTTLSSSTSFTHTLFFLQSRPLSLSSADVIWHDRLSGGSRTFTQDEPHLPTLTVISFSPQWLEQEPDFWRCRRCVQRTALAHLAVSTPHSDVWTGRKCFWGGRWQQVERLCGWLGVELVFARREFDFDRCAAWKGDKLRNSLNSASWGFIQQLDDAQIYTWTRYLHLLNHFTKFISVG